LTAFSGSDVLGKPVQQVPDNYERGELLMDSATDLETNASVAFRPAALVTLVKVLSRLLR
jgi:hypothetical protein